MGTALGMEYWLGEQGLAASLAPRPPRSWLPRWLQPDGARRARL